MFCTRVLLLTTILLGTTSCATLALEDKYTQWSTTWFEKVESYKVTDHKLESICVSARLNSEKTKNFTLIIEDDSWSHQCDRPQGGSRGICKAYVPVIFINNFELKQGCEHENGSSGYKFTIGPAMQFSRKDNSILVSDAYTQRKLFYIYAQSIQYESPTLARLKPAAVAVDVVTFPVQVVVYSALFLLVQIARF